MSFEYSANLVPGECRRKPKRKEATRESEAIKSSWSNCSKPSQTRPGRFERRGRLLTEDSNGQSRSLMKKWGSAQSIEDCNLSNAIVEHSPRDLFRILAYESYFLQQVSVKILYIDFCRGSWIERVKGIVIIITYSSRKNSEASVDKSVPRQTSKHILFRLFQKYTFSVRAFTILKDVLFYKILHVSQDYRGKRTTTNEQVIDQRVKF